MATLRHICDRLFWRLERRLAPGLVNSQHHYLQALSRHVRPGIDWLDVGCGRQIVPAWIKSSADRERDLIAPARRVVGIDLNLPDVRGHRSINHRTVACLTDLPFADESFDLVTANMVVEHLDDPPAALAQIRRVLKPGGVFLFHTPNARHPAVLLSRLLPAAVKHRLIAFFENRAQRDVFPTHYRMNTRPAVVCLGGLAGLDVAELRMVESSPNTLMLGPLVVAEMLFIRAARRDSLAGFRADIVGALQKPHREQRLAA